MYTKNVIKLVSLPSILNLLTSFRITSIIFIYFGACALHIQSIGLEIGVYDDLFHVTTISQLLDIIIFTISYLILKSWPKFYSDIVNDLNILTKNYKDTLKPSTLLNSTQLLYLHLFLSLF